MDDIALNVHAPTSGPLAQSLGLWTDPGLTTPSCPQSPIAAAGSAQPKALADGGDGRDGGDEGHGGNGGQGGVQAGAALRGDRWRADRRGPADRVPGRHAGARGRASGSGFRAELVERVRREIAQGRYETPARLEAAADALLSVIRRRD